MNRRSLASSQASSKRSLINEPATTRKSIITPALPPITIDEHLLEFDDLVERYGPAINKDNPKKSPGLSLTAIDEQREKGGANVIPTPKKPPLIVAYFEQMANVFSFVLLVCGALSITVFIIDPSLWINLYTGLLFWFVAFFNAALEFWQAYSSAKVLEGFLSLVPTSVLVIRASQIQEIPANEVVVGDLVMIKTGDKVPADIRLIWSDNVRVDNSSLTGESEPQERNANASTDDVMEAKNLVFSGTILISGNAVGVVIRVGPHTVIGRLAAFAVAAPKRISRLEHEMTIFIRRLVLCAFAFGMLALILAFSLGLDVTYAINAAVGIFISFLPQGLPATMTILLTTAAKRMADRNVLVKELRSVETLGSMTLLATDKTGTLTLNKMSVVGGWIYGKIYNSAEEIDAIISKIDEFATSVTLCTSCKLDDNERDKQVEDRNIFGDATEVGILQYFGKYYELDPFFEKNEKILELPFSSATKWHLTIYARQGRDNYTVLMKGAPERVLNHCATFKKDNDETIEIDQTVKEEFQRKYEYFASNGLRIIAVAKKELSKQEFPMGFEFKKDPQNFPSEGLEFLGFVCLRDPPKPGVSWAIGRLREAGIAVTMVTGDHPFTAEAIGKQVGIITSPEFFRRPPTASDVEHRPLVKAAVIHGDDIESMTKSDWIRLAGLKEIIFARTAPRHKLEIVKQFQAVGHIVAVSGDGVNDSPALQKANLGISMNRTASDVSKDSAHMILLDDNFVSIVAGVFEGRLIFENVKKSIRYTLTHITAEVSALLVYALLLIPLPLTPILLIFIDVFSELGPAVSFAREPPEYDLMALLPRQKVKATVPIERRLYRALSKHSCPQWMKRLVVWIVPLFYLESTGENLIDFDLVFWVFFEGGVIVAMGAWGAYILALVANKVPLDKLYRADITYFHEGSPPLTLTDGTVADASQQLYILGSVQAAYFLAILICQWFNVFMQKHRYRQIYGWDMFINWTTYLGIFCAMVVASIVCFIPALNEVFQTQIPPGLAIAAPFAAAMLLLAYEFVRRYLRARGYFGGVPSPKVLVPFKGREGIEAPTIPRARELSISGRPEM